MNPKAGKNRRTRFSIIDFVIILMLLACIVGAVMRYNIAESLFSKTVTQEMTVNFIAEALTENKVSAFNENAVFYSGNDSFGKLISVNSSPAIGYYENAEGIYTEYEKEGLYDISGSFVCELVRSDSGYLLNGKTYIAPGSVFTLKSGGAAVSVLITALEPAE